MTDPTASCLAAAAETGWAADEKEPHPFRLDRLTDHSNECRPVGWLRMLTIGVRTLLDGDATDPPNRADIGGPGSGGKFNVRSISEEDRVVVEVACAECLEVVSRVPVFGSLDAADLQNHYDDQCGARGLADPRQRRPALETTTKAKEQVLHPVFQEEKAMTTAEMIAEKDVTPENLAALFKRAFFEVSRDDDGDVVVQTDGPLIFVRVRDNKLIKYMAVYKLKANTPLERKHAFVNRLNDEVILCRFSVPQQNSDLMIADYYMPFGESVPAFQIVSALRSFSRVVLHALGSYDDDNLVE